MTKILIVDDDTAGCRTLELHLRAQGHITATAHSVDQGLAAAAEFAPELIILDIRMPGRSGLDGLEDFRRIAPETGVIMITAFHDMESTIAAMQKGALDYIHKPIDIDELDQAIAKAVEQAGQDIALSASGPAVNGRAGMVGRSRAMKEIFNAQQAETTDARIIAATNADLTGRVADGGFREDLFFRLQVVNIHLPPLRDRMEDLPDLVETLLGRIDRDSGNRCSHLSAEALACFRGYRWPGNVRELENRLLKAVALSPGPVLMPDLFPELCPASPSVDADDLTPVERMSLAEVERIHVQRILDATGWHRGRACEILGVSRPRLRRLIRDHGLSVADDSVEAPLGDDGDGDGDIR